MQLQARGFVEVRTRKGWYVVEPSIERGARRLRRAPRGRGRHAARGQTEGRPLQSVIRKLRQHIKRRAARDRRRRRRDTRVPARRLPRLPGRMPGPPLLADMLRDLTARTTLVASLYQSTHDARAVVRRARARSSPRSKRAIDAGGRALMLAHIGNVEDALGAIDRPGAADARERLRATLAPLARPALHVGEVRRRSALRATRRATRASFTPADSAPPANVRGRRCRRRHRPARRRTARGCRLRGGVARDHRCDRADVEREHAPRAVAPAPAAAASRRAPGSARRRAGTAVRQRGARRASHEGVALLRRNPVARQPRHQRRRCRRIRATVRRTTAFATGPRCGSSSVSSRRRVSTSQYGAGAAARADALQRRRAVRTPARMPTHRCEHRPSCARLQTRHGFGRQRRGDGLGKCRPARRASRARFGSGLRRAWRAPSRRSRRSSAGDGMHAGCATAAAGRRAAPCTSPRCRYRGTATRRSAGGTAARRTRRCRRADRAAIAGVALRRHVAGRADDSVLLHLRERGATRCARCRSR